LTVRNGYLKYLPFSDTHPVAREVLPAVVHTVSFALHPVLPVLLHMWRPGLYRDLRHEKYASWTSDPAILSKSLHFRTGVAAVSPTIKIWNV
jgi:hypothetical protein